MEIKIPLYNILNMFLTGLIFIGGCVFIYPNWFLDCMNNPVMVNLGAGPEIIFTVCAFAVAYEIGLIINRIGSIIIEPLLKKIRLIPFDNDYSKYNRCKIRYPIMNILSREYSLSRTSITLFLLLLMLSLLARKFKISIVFLCVLLVFCFSCRKHAAKIVDLMKTVDE